ncbi:MAG: hypothetical protein Q8N88_06115 [Nanoarchaeota archaeon]|nr:hypothetical protein [Nanoarchaeota archaeon]
MTNELVRTRSELESLAELMVQESKGDQSETVVRYTQVSHDVVSFIDGKIISNSSLQSNLNKELMGCPGVYTLTGVDRLTEQNYKELVVARDLQPLRFQFAPKEI